MEILTRRP